MAENNLERENKKYEGASRENNRIKVSFSSNKLIIFFNESKQFKWGGARGKT